MQINKRDLALLRNRGPVFSFKGEKDNKKYDVDKHPTPFEEEWKQEKKERCSQSKHHELDYDVDILKLFLQLPGKRFHHFRPTVC